MLYVEMRCVICVVHLLPTRLFRKDLLTSKLTFRVLVQSTRKSIKIKIVNARFAHNDLSNTAAYFHLCTKTKEF